MTPAYLADLQPYAPRRFLPSRIAFEDLAQLAAFFDGLAKKASGCRTTSDFEQWLLDWSELSAVVQEEGARRFIAMSSRTDDSAAEQAHLHYVSAIQPVLKSGQFDLARVFVAHPLRSQLPRERYEVLNRSLEAQVELFREENLPLQAEESRLVQSYRKLCGAQTVLFQGQEKTLSQMGPLMEGPDRTVRETAWKLIWARRLQDAETCDSTFDQLLRLRTRIAENAGFANYRDYAFRSRHRFDYTPDDCLRFHEAVETEVMPALHRMYDRRRRRLELPTLRPWDLVATSAHEVALHPFSDEAELAGKNQRIVEAVDVEFGQSFSGLREKHLLDLASRKGKAPGGYCCPLGESRVPFIFMNAVGTQRDVQTLLHETGHALHDLAARSEDLHAYRQAPFEFCEFAAMSMELLGSEHWSEFYSAPDTRRARRQLLEGVLILLPWVATIDAFQHWLYTHPGHSARERTAQWTSLLIRFGERADWSELTHVRDRLWHRQLHLFLSPFYYIEYGIAQIGALQLWRNSRADKPAAIQAFKASLALGASRPLPELFRTAGCPFDMSADTVRDVVRLVEAQLDELGG